MSEDDDLEEVDRSTIRARRDELARRATEGPAPAPAPAAGPKPLPCLSMPEMHRRRPPEGADAQPTPCLSVVAPGEDAAFRRHELEQQGLATRRRRTLLVMALLALVILAALVWRFVL